MRYYLTLTGILGFLTIILFLLSKPMVKTDLSLSGDNIDRMGLKIATYIEQGLGGNYGNVALLKEVKNTTYKSEK